MLPLGALQKLLFFQHSDCEYDVPNKSATFSSTFDLFVFVFVFLNSSFSVDIDFENVPRNMGNRQSNVYKLFLQ